MKVHWLSVRELNRTQMHVSFTTMIPKRWNAGRPCLDKTDKHHYTSLQMPFKILCKCLWKYLLIIYVFIAVFHGLRREKEDWKLNLYCWIQNASLYIPKVYKTNSTAKIVQQQKKYEKKLSLFDFLIFFRAWHVSTRVTLVLWLSITKISTWTVM